MALAQPEAQSQPEGRSQPLVFRLDPLHNWSDVVILGFTIVFATYMAVGELLSRGLSKDPGLYNDLSIFAPLAVGLSTMAWRRFRRVRLIVDDEQVEAVSLWGVRKRCPLADLTTVTEEGRPSARELVFLQGDRVAFRVWRRVWTAMQLSTLSVFIGVPVSGVNRSVRLRLSAWTATIFLLAIDGLFVFVGGAVLAGAVTADTNARAYQRATTLCWSPAPSEDRCYGVLPVTVDAVGNRNFSEYRLSLHSTSRRYDVTARSNEGTYDKFRVGMATNAKVWKGKLTLVEADDNNWTDTTDNPFYQEQWTRTGLPTWLVAFCGLIPLLSRLHPIIS